MSELSDIAKAILERGRQGKSFDVANFFGLGGKQIPKIYFRLAVKAEDNDAIVAAHAYAAEAGAKAGVGAEAARNDADILSDSKHIEFLWRACRKDDEREYDVFPSPSWMRENLRTDEIGALLHLYNETKRALGPAPKFDDEGIDALISIAIAAASSGERMPQQVLATLNREAVTEAFVCAAIKLDVVRRECAEWMAECDRQREEIKALRGAKPSQEAAPIDDAP